MKTAISIDTGIYRDAEAAAAVMGLTRSRLYTLALEEYLRNHREEAVTEQLDRYYKNHPGTKDEGLKQAAF
ncbi:MAG: hypothetical protein LBG10_01555, partial [Treponema sp.]|nr:hypothetical protein [Treponema sp.]